MSATLKWGLITGMVYVIFSLVSNMLGLQQGGGGSVGISMLVNILLFTSTFFCIFLGVKEARDDEKEGIMSLGEGFKSGLKIAVVAGLISALFSFIYMKFIDPDMAGRILEAAEDQWDKANMPEEQREMSRKITGMFLNPLILAPFTLIWVAFWGAIKGLISGAILKKEAPPTIPMAE